MRLCSGRALVGAMATAALALCAGAANGQIVISQVWGGGGFAAAAPNADCVELLNISDSAINLEGFSLQVAAPTGAWTVRALPAFDLNPGQFYLIQLETSSGTGTALPTPDFFASPTVTSLSSTGGKVALVDGLAALPSGTAVIPCPPPDNILDLVGYGTSANWREFEPDACPGATANNAPAGSTATPPGWVTRICNGFTDTNRNSADFVRSATPFRNSSTTLSAGANFSSAASPTPIVSGVATDVTITTTVATCAGSPIAGLTATADLSAINGPFALALLDNGIFPDAALDDGVYTGQASVTPATNGAFTITSTVSGTVSGSPSAPITVVPPPPTNDVACTAELIPGLPYSGISTNAAQATADPDNDCNSGTVSNLGLWWRFDATANGAVLVTETGSIDTVLVAYSGPDCNTLTQIQCSDDAPTTSEETLAFPVTAGQSYWILVTTWTATSTTGTYSVNFDAFTAVPNDTICSATPIPSGGLSETVDARSALPDADIACNVTGVLNSRQGIWYSVSGGLFGATLTAAESGTSDVVYGLFSGADCATAVEVNCITAETANFVLSANTNYWLLVSLNSLNDSSGAAAPFALNLSAAEPTGACCVGTTCSILSVTACLGSSGTFVGGPCAGFNGENTADFPIADYAGSYNPVNSQITVSNSSGTVTSLTVSIDMAHTFVGDLRAELVGPGGSPVVTLFDGPAPTACIADGVTGDGSGMTGIFNFTDAASTTIRAEALALGTALVPGDYLAADCNGTPISLNTSFAGAPANGTWTLRVGDRDEIIAGTLLGWSIGINGGVTVNCASACPLDLSANGIVDADDIFAFLNIWFAGPPGGTCSGCTADWDGDGNITADDIFSYLNAWFAFGPGTPCP